MIEFMCQSDMTFETMEEMKKEEKNNQNKMLFRMMSGGKREMVDDR